MLTKIKTFTVFMAAALFIILPSVAAAASKVSVKVKNNTPHQVEAVYHYLPVPGVGGSPTTVNSGETKTLYSTGVRPRCFNDNSSIVSTVIVQKADTKEEEICKVQSTFKLIGHGSSILFNCNTTVPSDQMSHTFISGQNNCGVLPASVDKSGTTVTITVH